MQPHAKISALIAAQYVLGRPNNIFACKLAYITELGYKKAESKQEIADNDILELAKDFYCVIDNSQYIRKHCQKLVGNLTIYRN
jgi:hypothetical protein